MHKCTLPRKVLVVLVTLRCALEGTVNIFYMYEILICHGYALFCCLMYVMCIHTYCTKKVQSILGVGTSVTS